MPLASRELFSYLSKLGTNEGKPVWLKPKRETELEVKVFVVSVFFCLLSSLALFLLRSTNL